LQKPWYGGHATATPVAVRVLFNYLLGRPTEHDILERIDTLEAGLENERTE